MVVDKFIIREKRSVLIEIERFLYYIEEIKERNFSKFNLIMGSLIGDVYEILKWKEKLDVCFSREKALLQKLESTKGIEEAIKACLDVDAVSLFLTNVYCSEDITLCEKINAKNNIRNVKTNSIIMDLDKLKIFEDYYFTDNKLIFNKEYNKTEYLDLYKVIQDDLYALSGYIDIIYGLALYTPDNYKKLVMDMCIEFYVQKNISNDNEELDCEEDYLLYLIRYADVDHLLKVVTENRFMMEPLAYSFTNSIYYDEGTKEQVNNNKEEVETQKIYKRLQKESKK